MKTKILIFLLCCISFFSAKALEETNGRIDSLKQLSLQLQQDNKQKELLDCYEDIADIYMNSGNYQQAIVWFDKAVVFSRAMNDEGSLSTNMMYLGMSYNQMGDHPKGLQIMRDALHIAEKNKDERRIAQISMFIGSGYSEGANQDYSIRYFRRTQQLAAKLKDTLLLLEADMYIANNYYYNKRYDKAIEIYTQVAQITAERKDDRLQAGALGNIGNVYADIGAYETALGYQFRAVELFKIEQDNQGLTICYSAIGTSYYLQKKYTLAIKYYNEALKLANEMNSWEDLIEIHQGLSKTYEALNDYKNAYGNFKLYKQYNDSVYNEGNTKKLTEMELNYRFQAQQKEQELAQKNKEVLSDEKLKRQQLLSYASIAGVVLLLLFAGIVLRSNSQRKKANVQLQQFNNAVVQQKAVIEYKNKEITDSINYAKRIQESILPVRDDIKQAFPQSFVLFKPRDVVSGDFYWFAQQGGKKIIACVDCTGHGVPGAFMSMIGNTLLNEIVNEKGITKPSEILNLLHERVRQSLKQDQENAETRDGMDLALCAIDSYAGTLEFAGANRPLYIIRNNVLEEIRPTKSPIGGDKMDEDRKFINNELKLLAGDSIYMTTDGYADQFGGEKGKKFMVKRFQEILVGIQHQTLEQQGDTLKTTIESWQGDIEQVDDILVIGIRI